MNTARMRGRTLFLALLYSYCAVLVLAFLLLRGISTYSWATVPQLVDGTAHRPFVTRALVPAVVGGIVRATPWLESRVTSRMTRAVADARPGQRMDRALATLGWTPADTYVHLVASGVMLACFAGLPWVLRRLVQVCYDAPPAVADLAPVFGLLALPLFFVPYARYLYDPGTLLLWSLALLWVIQRRHVALWLLLPVIAFHKETAVLLPPLIALREWPRAPRGRVLGVLALQLAVVAAVRVALGMRFAGNPGETVLFVGPGHTRDLFVNLLRRPPYVPAVVAMLGALVAPGWRGKDAFLRRAFLLVLLPLVLLSFAFGYVDEIRGYYETWALVVLLAVPTVVNLLGAGPVRAPVREGG